MSGLFVVEPGPQTTVQDLGRPGYLRYGIPPSGPMDREAFCLANRLVGNPESAAGLECTVQGPRLEIRQESVVAVTGAEMPFRINGQPAPLWQAVLVRPGDLLQLGMVKTGCRAYLAAAGGIDVPPALGSRATYLRGRLGGVEGRALQKGDLLPVGVPPERLDAVEGRRVRPDLVPSYPQEVECRVILGPQDDRFTPEGIEAFLAGPYQVTPQVDRMGYRLKGPGITYRHGHDIVSDGIPLGGVQVPGGQPIVLLVDRQSTGGYTKIATVITPDIARIGQTKPGHGIRFRRVSLAKAHALLRAEAGRWQDAILQ
ncbi:MAG: biotin-dependent carboxyltransferase [Candidatus Rokubacteria bacterium]|nr:biotin-dependent carboxyltransferase [Candidatus Rokubacteria bacterium]